MKVELTVGPAPAMILRALRVEGRLWQGEDGLSRCVGRPAEGWLAPGSGRFYLWRGIVQELCSVLNTRSLELTVRGGGELLLRKALSAQAEDLDLRLHWVPGPAGDAVCDSLSELKTRARPRWLRRRLERLERLPVSPWRFQLVCDPDGLQGRLLTPALTERQCRAGEQPLFRLALAGRNEEAAAFLQAEAKVDGPPLVICAPAETAEALIRCLPCGTEVFTAEDGTAMLDTLETMVQERLFARALSALLAELLEEAGGPENWTDAAAPAALESLRQRLQAAGTAELCGEAQS